MELFSGGREKGAPGSRGQEKGHPEIMFGGILKDIYTYV